MLYSGEFDEAIQLVEQKRHATELAMSNCATALATAEQHQANNIQIAAYGRVQAACTNAIDDYSVA